MTKCRLIIEGVDGTGKTTIANALAPYLNAHVYKSGREHKLFGEKNAQLNVLKWAVYEQLKMVELCEIDIIFDRLFPSEWVYSKAFNRESDNNLVLSYDRWWNKLGGKIVFLTKSNNTKDDEIIDKEKYAEIEALYAKYAEESTCDVLVLDTSDEDIAVQINKILEFIGVE
jgi:thymidylate kinase